MTITIDPTELQPGDIIVCLGDHDESGCHCDVRVTILRSVRHPALSRPDALRESARQALGNSLITREQFADLLNRIAFIERQEEEEDA